MKIAVNAGHGRYTAGRRCLKQFDPQETREWVMNDRVARHVIAGLAGCDGVQTLRIDDPTGEEDYTLTPRTDKANKWGADYYIGIHHNAGVNGGSGGGTVVYRQDGSTVAATLQKAVYEEMIAAAGLKGNRATPLAQADFAETRQTKMPAILIECGFMDSSVDTPLICREDMSIKFARGIVGGLVKLCGLSLPVQTPAPTPGGSFHIGDIVDFIGGYHYSNAQADVPSGSERIAGKAQITGMALTSRYPYHLIGEKGGSNVYGWVKASTIRSGTDPTPVPADPPKPVEFKKGDIVKIKAGSQWYTGKFIPSWVMEDTWVVCQDQLDDRVVIDANVSGKNNIMSPINAVNLIRV